jgi:hypothetical protein
MGNLIEWIGSVGGGHLIERESGKVTINNPQTSVILSFFASLITKSAKSGSTKWVPNNPFDYKTRNSAEAFWKGEALFMRHTDAFLRWSGPQSNREEKESEGSDVIKWGVTNIPFWDLEEGDTKGAPLRKPRNNTFRLGNMAEGVSILSPNIRGGVSSQSGWYAIVPNDPRPEANVTSIFRVLNTIVSPEFQSILFIKNHFIPSHSGVLRGNVSRFF